MSKGIESTRKYPYMLPWRLFYFGFYKWICKLIDKERNTGPFTIFYAPGLIFIEKTRNLHCRNTIPRSQLSVVEFLLQCLRIDSWHLYICPPDALKTVQWWCYQPWPSWKQWKRRSFKSSFEYSFLCFRLTWMEFWSALLQGIPQLFSLVSKCCHSMRRRCFTPWHSTWVVWNTLEMFKSMNFKLWSYTSWVKS